ncbi:Ff.00g115330.m01.CDS01, partial [Fusarium sp. VM40]
MAPLRILISGAGIAGPAFAFWATRLGHSCTIVERSPTLRNTGQQIDIRSHAVEVIKLMGLLQDVRDLTSMNW